MIRLILGQWLGVKKRALRIGVGLVQSVKGGPEKNGWGLGGVFSRCWSSNTN